MKGKFYLTSPDPAWFKIHNNIYIDVEPDKPVFIETLLRNKTHITVKNENGC